jgi:drug/metabolite transporter (DMT)-like permease
VLATVGYALAGVMTREHVSGRIANVWAAAIQLGCGVLFLGPFTWAMHGPPPLALPPAAAGSLLALGLLGTGFAFLIFFSLLQRVGATNTSLVTYLVPVVGLVQVGAQPYASRSGGLVTSLGQISAAPDEDVAA